MARFWHDVRYGIRMMAKSPIISGVAVFSLALGIAANASVFSIVNAWLFEPLPYAEQDRLVLLRTLEVDDPIELAGGISVSNFRDLVEASPGVEAATI